MPRHSKQYTSAPMQVPPVSAAKHNGADSDLVLNDCLAYLRFDRYRPFASFAATQGHI